MTTARDPLRRIQKWPRLTTASLAGASGLTKPRQNKPDQALHVTRSSVSAGHKHAPVEGPRQHIERQFHVDARIDLPAIDRPTYDLTGESAFSGLDRRA